MPGENTATKPQHIDNKFASSKRELRANRPFWGAISRVRNGQHVMLDYVKREDRLTLPKWLEQKDISEGQFILETTDGQTGEELTIEFLIDKNAQSKEPAGFFEQSQPSGPVQKELEAQVLRLKNEVEEASRKRRSAEDELYKYKRENSDQTGELKEQHRKEIDTLKESHREQVDTLKEEIRQKDWETKMLEMQQMNENGSPSVGNRLLDMLQSNLNDDFFANLLTMLHKSGGLQNATPQQLQGAFHKTAAQQASQTGPDETGTRNNPQSTQAPQQQAANLSPEEQMQQAKATVAEHLGKMAVDALMNNVEFRTYADAVRKQLQINKQHGIDLDAKQWIEMAKMLSEKALTENMSSEKVAKVIEPALDMLPKQARMMMGMIKPQMAANKLFTMYNIDASAKVKELVIDVLDQLLNGTTQTQN